MYIGQTHMNIIEIHDQKCEFNEVIRIDQEIHLFSCNFMKA